jgi:hypothetical protein
MRRLPVHRTYSVLAAAPLLTSTAMAQAGAMLTIDVSQVTQPSLIVPVESSLHDLASHAVPGYTIQVLELKAQ